MQFPELVWLDRFDLLVPIAFGTVMFGLGAALAAWAPQLGTSGAQMLVWGYVISTVVLTHVTLLVNSLGHRVGRRRFETRDDSRNSWWLALLTLGEGWHNNHHRFAGAARQGFYWWEVDVSYYVLRLLACFGWIRELRSVPDRVLEEGRR
jgi:stearoyl-CoA desaturase (delta-9 desaturase)